MTVAEWKSLAEKACKCELDGPGLNQYIDILASDDVVLELLARLEAMEKALKEISNKSPNAFSMVRCAEQALSAHGSQVPLGNKR